MAADIRACVNFARNQYKPTSLGLVGFCYGGGRALEEAAAGIPVLSCTMHIRYNILRSIVVVLLQLSAVVRRGTEVNVSLPPHKYTLFSLFSLLP